MATRLQSNGNPVRVGRVTLRTPGLEGEATSHPAANLTAMRAAEESTPVLEEAFRRQGVRPQETIEIINTREVPVAVDVTRRQTSFGEPAITAEVPAPGGENGQFVLYTDESGVTTWHFPLDPHDQIDVTRGAGVRTYVIPRRVPPSGTKGTRGLIGAIGKKLLKVLVFPLIDPVLGKVGDYFVQRWEARNRPYRIRTFTPDDYSTPGGRPLDAANWTTLARGRALLMVHGTFSQADSAFGVLPRATVDLLYQRYEGRVFAFDHYTLSEDPNQNVDWFMRQIPTGVALHSDIICHSRGGLVSRALAHPKTPGSSTGGTPALSVHRIVFAGTPNNGTVLADTKYMGDFLDSYTSLLNLFPDSAVVGTFETIVAVAKQLAVDTVKGLEGLQAMLPGGPFLTDLNQRDPGSAQYFALASEYHSTHPGLACVETQLMASVFRAANDLVVPTESMYSQDSAPDLVPVANRHIFGAGDEVTHGGYFLNQVAQQKIEGWLTQPEVP